MSGWVYLVRSLPGPLSHVMKGMKELREAGRQTIRQIVRYFEKIAHTESENIIYIHVE